MVFIGMRHQLPGGVSEKIAVDHARRVSHHRSISGASEHVQNMPLQNMPVQNMPVQNMPLDPRYFQQYSSFRGSHQRSSSRGSEVPMRYASQLARTPDESLSYVAPCKPYVYPQNVPGSQAMMPHLGAGHRRIQSRQDAVELRPPFAVIYYKPASQFCQKEGVLELVCRLLDIPFVLSPVEDANALIGRAKLAPGGLLGGEFPIVEFRGRVYIQWISIGRMLARQYGVYGGDPDKDYYADAILDCLRPWFEDQSVAVTSVHDRFDLAEGYLKERSLYYQTLGQMFKSYSHLTRAERGVSWVDAYILGAILDDNILDSHGQERGVDFVPTSELLRSHHCCAEFYNVMTMTPIIADAIGNFVDSKLNVAAPVKENSRPASQQQKGSARTTSAE